MTPTHQRIAFALLRKEQQGEPAFVPDLVQALNYAAESSLTPTLRIMEREGWVIIQGGGARGRSRVVSLTSQGRFALGAGGIPLLGSIPAGPLAEAVAQPEEIVENILPSRPGDFLLKVRGDSMEGDGILDGDWVLLRPGVAPRHGEIAAAQVGDAHEATLKRIFFEPETASVILRASNPRYADMIVPAEELQVAGVFRGLVRHANAGE